MRLEWWQFNVNPDPSHLYFAENLFYRKKYDETPENAPLFSQAHGSGGPEHRLKIQPLFCCQRNWRSLICPVPLWRVDNVGLVFLQPSLPWINLGGNNLLGLCNGRTKNRHEQIHPPLFTDVLYGLSPPVILIFSTFVGHMVKCCLSSERHFLTRRAFPHFFERWGPLHVAAALWFVIYPLMGLMERNVGLEGGCERDVTAPGAGSPAPGVLEMLSKQNRNSRKLLKIRSCLWAWHGESLLFLARPPSHVSSRENSSLLCLPLQSPVTQAAAVSFGDFGFVLKTTR